LVEKGTIKDGWLVGSNWKLEVEDAENFSSGVFSGQPSPTQRSDDGSCANNKVNILQLVQCIFKSIMDLPVVTTTQPHLQPQQPQLDGDFSTKDPLIYLDKLQLLGRGSFGAVYKGRI
jgi:hypothetical protein